MTRDFAKVGVVGLGTMGAGIAEVMARSGVNVVGIESTAEALERGRGHVEDSTARAVTRGKLSAGARQAILDAVTFSTSLTDVKDADLVIEAIPERLAPKQQLFADLDAACAPETILATNTSSLSVTEIAVATTRPAQVIGLHFFNPAPVMKLVEVVTTVVTDPQVVSDVEALAQRLGKVDVTVGDRAGFIANALLFGYLNHAVSMFESGYAGREDIDAAMTLGCGLPMGPLALLDLIGIDTAQEILDTMYRQSGDRLHAPAPYLRQLVTAGRLGRKRGRGFYSYQQPDSPVVVPDADTPSAPGPAAGAREVSRVGLVGSGVLATQLAEVFTEAGYQVTRVGEPALSEPALSELAGIQLVGTELAGCELVVEAAGADAPVTAALFGALDLACPGAVLASTSSLLPIIDLAAATSRPGDVVGMHVTAPTVTTLIEVVRTVATSDEAVATVSAVCRRLGRQPVGCGDRAGFIVNALLFPYLNDAVKMLEAHYASADDIDAAMKLGCGFPVGPIEALDAIGLDVALAVQRTLYQEFREPGFAPAPLLTHLVTAGYLGRTSGRGFREHPAP